MPTDTPDRTPVAAKPVYRFGEFEVRSDSGEVFHNGSPLRVQEQSLQVLLAMLENPGAVVSRDQLRERLWPDGTYVDFEHSLNAAVKRLRAALGDDADSPRFIETLPKRGYRLVASVSRNTTPAAMEAPVGSPVEPRRRPRLRPVVIAAAVLLMAAAVILTFSLRRRTSTDANASSAFPAPPQNTEAYELYLRSLAYKAEYPANQQAIALLERSVALDRSSARSWYELARRYESEFIYSMGGQGSHQQAREANRHALEIAPDFSPARLQKVMLDVEEGEAVSAYREALAITQTHPQDANAHFALSYALRIGGMYEEAGRECDLALKLDASNPGFRSCSLVYVLLGRYDRVPAYINLDPLSVYVRYRRMELAILRNDRTAALEEARSIRLGHYSYLDVRMMEAVLSGASPETVQTWSRQAEALFDRINTPEFLFVEARYQSWAGQTGPALRLLRRAIANNYCAYPVMDSDPFLARIRQLPEYKELRQAGIACRENFRSQMRDH